MVEKKSQPKKKVVVNFQLGNFFFGQLANNFFNNFLGVGIFTTHFWIFAALYCFLPLSDLKVYFLQMKILPFDATSRDLSENDTFTFATFVEIRINNKKVFGKGANRGFLCFVCVFHCNFG